MAGIPDDMMGDVWPAAQPGPDGADYGHISFAPNGRFQVRSFQTFTIVYTVGEYGLDDTGAIKVVQRWTGDQGGVQFANPKAANYVTATASNGVHLALYAEPYPHQRPWYNGLRVAVERGYMEPGDTITIVYGDRSGGGPGYRLQTFCESAFEFKVLADPCATGVFLPVGSAAIEIVAGPVDKWTLVSPSLRRRGEAFSLGIRAEDQWGNACDRVAAELVIEASRYVEGLPARISFPEDARGTRIEGLRIAEDGVTRFLLKDSEGDILAQSNPLVTRESGAAAYWGDLHGQSGETVGINPMREYLEFARDVAFLDVTSHQANDFQITNRFWEEINALSAEFDQDGAFTVFPGYEWSGNTAVGGDHNVFFRDEGRQIRRSSHALLTDRGDIETDARTVTDLFNALEDEDCVIYAHVGGRPADIAFDHDPGLRRAVEVHSDWGTFEWIMTDAFELGYRVGLVCNSDGHKGAPGACHPGASEFGAYSGLTCFFADNLCRDGIFDSLRRRHHFGTTGCRMLLEVSATLGPGGLLFEEDPAASDRDAIPCETAMMGDIVTTMQAEIPLRILCHAHAPIERIEVLHGAHVVQTLRPYSEADLGNRIRVIWQGAQYRGRGRQTRWYGTLNIHGQQIERFAKINAWNHERPFHQDGPGAIHFDSVTTGNFSGCDLWLDGDLPGALEIQTDLVQGRFDLSDIGLEDQVLEAGGLDRKMRIFRLPQTLRNTDYSAEIPIRLTPTRDTPIWVRITTEDGHKAWSSPIYCIGAP
ncbi:MAG: DUF3604 domain-containing protein [Pseudomonadota bacterium]